MGSILNTARKDLPPGRPLRQCARLSQPGALASSRAELSLDEKLRSQAKLGIRRSGGTPLPDGIGASMHRDDLRLQLTLDTRLQRVAQQELLRQVEKWNAKRGAALVMDARNGELLAWPPCPPMTPTGFGSSSLAVSRMGCAGSL